MNKILVLLLLLVFFYQSISPFMKLWKSRKIKRKEYKVTFSKQFHHLFSATLLLLFPLLLISSYYSFYSDLPIPVKIGLAVLACLCWISASVSFYLYAGYKKKTPYISFIYDTAFHSMELLNTFGSNTIRLSYVDRVEWYSIQDSMKMMPWSNFEYFILVLRNNSKVVVTSLMIDPRQLLSVLSNVEIIHYKKIIPTIK